ncbi:MAG: hypothetical protein ACE5HI_20720, partial [bacterium]
IDIIGRYRIFSPLKWRKETGRLSPASAWDSGTPVLHPSLGEFLPSGWPCLKSNFLLCGL